MNMSRILNEWFSYKVLQISKLKLLSTLDSKINTLFIKGMGGNSLFSQHDLILKSFIQATRCFLQISKIQSNFWDIGDQSGETATCSLWEA